MVGEKAVLVVHCGSCCSEAVGLCKLKGEHEIQRMSLFPTMEPEVESCPCAACSCPVEDTQDAEEEEHLAAEDCQGSLDPYCRSD